MYFLANYMRQFQQLWGTTMFDANQFELNLQEEEEEEGDEKLCHKALQLSFFP
jgi:hypothetical protein